MASEIYLAHDHHASSLINDAQNLVPINERFPYLTSLKGEYSFGGFTPTNYWSDASLSPVVGSSTCSTETGSNNEEDFMADLAEQMTHFMLDNEEDEPHTPPEKAYDHFFSNSNFNSHWLAGGSRSCSSSTETLTHLPVSFLSNAAAWKDDSLALLHSVEAGKVAIQAGKAELVIPKTQGLKFLEQHVLYQTQEQINSEIYMGRKFEELSEKQVFMEYKKIPCCTPQWNLSKNSSSRKVDSAIVSHASSGPNPKSSSVAKNRHWKLHEDENNQNITQCQDRKHPRVQCSKSYQQCKTASRHGQMRTQNIWTTDQHGVRTFDPAFASNATVNIPIGSGMRAMFLSSGLGRESAGTGVFLPRCTGNNLDSKRKPAYSTVLLPTQTVPILNSHKYQRGGFYPQQYYSEHLSASTPERLLSFSDTGNLKDYSYSHQDYRHSYTTSSFPQCSKEINLPPEWTY